MGVRKVRSLRSLTKMRCPQRWGAPLLLALLLAGTVHGTGTVQLIHAPKTSGGIDPVVEAVRNAVFPNTENGIITEDFKKVALLVDAGSSKFALQVYGLLEDGLWVQSPTDDADYTKMFENEFNSPLGELTPDQIVSLFERTFYFKKGKEGQEKIILKNKDLKGKTIVCFLTGSHRNTWSEYGDPIVANMRKVAAILGCNFKIWVPTNEEEGRLELTSLNKIVECGINEDFRKQVQKLKLKCGACAGLGGQSVQMAFENNVVSSEGDAGLGRNGMKKCEALSLAGRIAEQWTTEIKREAKSLVPQTQFVSFISGFINMLERSFFVGKGSESLLPKLNPVVNKTFIFKKDLYAILIDDNITLKDPEAMKCLQLFAATVDCLDDNTRIWLQREFVCQEKKQYLLKAGIVSGALLMAAAAADLQEIKAILESWKTDGKLGQERQIKQATAAQIHAYVTKGNGKNLPCKFKKWSEWRKILKNFEDNGELGTPRRRMAQREFSSRRDSPVMTRLLEEIVRANQRHKELN